MDNEEFLDSRREPFKRGYVQVYTGNGKGKTTASIGLSVRAMGAGLRVYFAQFIKSGRYSEIKALEQAFPNQITTRQFGRGCFIKNDPTEEDCQLAQQGLEEVRQVIKAGKHQLVILDEANVAVWFRLFAVEDLLSLIKDKPEHVELVFTGRKVDQKLIDAADLVTEMTEVKHYYQQGVIARKGIES